MICLNWLHWTSVIPINIKFTTDIKNTQLTFISMLIMNIKYSKLISSFVLLRLKHKSTLPIVLHILKLVYFRSLGIDESFLTNHTQSSFHIEDFESSKFWSLIGEDTLISQIGPPLLAQSNDSKSSMWKELSVKNKILYTPFVQAVLDTVYDSCLRMKRTS